jgi:predicted nucleic acid-binding protein
MRIVLDTDVVVAAMRSPRGASAAVIRYLDQGRGTLLLSVPLALEYEAVCQLAEYRLAASLDAVVTAVAEKVSAMNTAAFFAERSRNADPEAFRRILNRAGGEPPRPDNKLRDQ